MLLGSLGGFLAGSVGAALAPSIAVLIVFRALQGIGGAIYPLTLSLARDELPDERVALGVGLLTGAFGLGTVLGFGVSGVIVEALSWRYLFAVAAALVAAAAVVVAAAPAARERTEPGRIGLPGALLLAGGLSLLLVALSEGTALGFGSDWVIGGFVLAAALLAGWVTVDLHAAGPLLDLPVLARPAVLVANLATLALGYVLFAGYFLVPYLVRFGGEGGSAPAAGPIGAGLYLLPAAIGQTIAAPAAAALLAPRMAARFVVAGGLALAAAALSVVSDLVTELVDRTQTGAATTINSTLRRVAGGVGAQVAAFLLATITLRPHLPANRAFVLAFAIGAAVAAAGAVAAVAASREGRSHPPPV